VFVGGGGEGEEEKEAEEGAHWLRNC